MKDSQQVGGQPIFKCKLFFYWLYWFSIWNKKKTAIKPGG